MPVLYVDRDKGEMRMNAVIGPWAGERDRRGKGGGGGRFGTTAAKGPPSSPYAAPYAMATRKTT